MSELKAYGNKTFVASYGLDAKAGVVISFGHEGNLVKDSIVYTENDGTKGSELPLYIYRGDSDQRLLVMHQLASKSANKWQLIKTKANFIAGAGLCLLDNNQKPIPDTPAFKAWLKKIKVKEYLNAAAYQIAFAEEINVRVSLDTATTKVTTIDVLDNNDVRAKKLEKTDTEIKKFYLNPNFGYSTKQLNEIDLVPIPAYDVAKPENYGVSLIHKITPVPGQKIYGMATWWGTEAWTRISNDVPKYYEAAFQNGLIITHHIEIPSDYCHYPKEDGTDPTAQDILDREGDLIKGLTDTISGIDKSNKIVATFTKMTTDGKFQEGIKINKIDFPINDEAFIKLLEASNLMNASGHGVPAKLAAVQLGSSMGSSGLEIIAEANYLQDFLCRFDRDLLLYPLELIKELDGIEPDYSLGIRRIESYTPDSTKKTDPSNPNNESNAI